jgi:hypothetical protein
MLTYLITSEVRRRLLRLLWLDGFIGSVSELSRLAGVGFASAYQELKQMKGAGLARSKVQGKALCFSANTDYENAPLLKKLLELGGTPLHSIAEQKLLEKFSTQDILLNLVRFGLPLGLSGNPTRELSLEATIAAGLRLAHHNATVARSLPVIFYQNKDQLNLQRLIFLADCLGEKQTLGFFLDLTFSLSGFTPFHRSAIDLRDRRVKKQQLFFEQNPGKYSKVLAEHNTPPIAKRWHFTMNLGMDVFETIFHKFCKEAV